MNEPIGTLKARRRLIASTAIVAVLLAGGPLIMHDLGYDTLGSPAYAKKCCFTADTLVLLHDGTPLEIHRIAVGDVVLGHDGTRNTVIGIERVPLGKRLLYGINGSNAFFTEEHPFLTDEGWRSVDPRSTFAETPSLEVRPMALGDTLVGLHAGPAIVGATALAPIVQRRSVRLFRLHSSIAPSDTELFNLLLDGDHTYVANGFVVHNKGGEGGEGGDSDGGGEGGDSDGGGEGGDSDGGGEGGDSDGGGEGGDSDGGGEGGDSDGGGEGGDSDGGGEGGERGDDSSSDDDGGERGRGRGRGRGGDDDRDDASSDDDGGEGGRGRGRGRGGDDDRDDASSDDDGGEGGGNRNEDSGSGGDHGFEGSSEPAGSDLSPEEERDLISRGWE